MLKARAHVTGVGMEVSLLYSVEFEGETPSGDSRHDAGATGARYFPTSERYA